MLTTGAFLYAPRAVADDRVTFQSTTYDPVDNSARIEWYPYQGAVEYQLRFHYPDASTCEMTTTAVQVTWNEQSNPCPLSRQRGRHYLLVWPIGETLNPNSSGSRSFFVDTPRETPPQGDVEFQIILRSEECELALGEIRGEIRRANTKITDVFWNPEPSISLLTSCGDDTRERIRVERGQRFMLFVNRKACTSFNANYLLSSDNPQILCFVDRNGTPTKDPYASSTVVPEPDRTRTVRVSMTPGTARITWRVPKNAKDAAITRYRVVMLPGGDRCTVKSKKRSCTFRNLTPGQEYRFSVRAANRGGWGEEVLTRSFTNPRPTPQPNVDPIPTPEAKPEPEFS